MCIDMHVDMRWVCDAYRWKALAEAVSFFEYRHVYGRAIDVPSAMADVEVLAMRSCRTSPCRHRRPRWPDRSRPQRCRGFHLFHETTITTTIPVNSCNDDYNDDVNDVDNNDYNGKLHHIQVRPRAGGH